MSRLVTLAITVITLLCGAGSALAQQYRDYDPAAEQKVSAPLFVTIAYALIWAVLLLYLVVLWRRQGALSGEIDQLKRQIETAESER